MSQDINMKRYWEKVASSDKVNWHIAHIDDENEFIDSGKSSLKKIFKKGLDVIEKGSKVLELGCGKGRIVRSLAEERPDIQCFGLDVSSEMISHAYNYTAHLNNTVFIVGNGSDLSLFPDNLFDIVYSYIVIQHLPRHIAESYILDAGRILKPGGRLIFQVQSAPAPVEIDPPITDFRKIRYYTPNQAEALVKDPMKVTEVRGKGHDLFIEAEKANLIEEKKTGLIGLGKKNL